MPPPERILLVEDEEFVRDSTTAVLVEEGFEVEACADLAAARTALDGAGFDLLLTDLRLGPHSGMELLAHPGVSGSGLPVIVITGHGTVDDAVAAMRAGAWDFLQKPIEPEQLVLSARRALEHGRLVGEVARLRRAVQGRRDGRELVGSSAAMVEVRRTIARVAAADATVLVSGESGTGKELAAAEIHRGSGRAKGPLVLVNCAAVPSTLFESEFFGHRRGAFSGAHADREGRFAEAQGGTLVLDEVHTLGADVQAKLLRALETGEYQMVGESRTRVVDVRVVAVTNEDLAGLVTQGDFRSDLYWRLNVFPLVLPPLREHKEDLPEIVAELLARARARAGARAAPSDLSPPALAALAAYDWPGNVRELRNVLERAAILAHGTEIEPELLARLLSSAPGKVAPAQRELDLRKRVEQAEREALVEALSAAGGSKKDAARLLGVDPKNLSYYLRKHDLAEGPR